MGRKNRRLVLRVKYVEGSNPEKVFGTRFMFSSNHRNTKSSKGRIVQSRKVSREMVLKVGEYNPLPDRLMREFKLNKGGEH